MTNKYFSGFWFFILIMIGPLFVQAQDDPMNEYLSQKKKELLEIREQLFNKYSVKDYNVPADTLKRYNTIILESLIIDFREKRDTIKHLDILKLFLKEEKRNGSNHETLKNLNSDYLDKFRTNGIKFEPRFLVDSLRKYLHDNSTSFDRSFELKKTALLSILSLQLIKDDFESNENKWVSFFSTNSSTGNSQDRQEDNLPKPIDPLNLENFSNQLNILKLTGGGLAGLLSLVLLLLFWYFYRKVEQLKKEITRLSTSDQNVNARLKEIEDNKDSTKTAKNVTYTPPSSQATKSGDAIQQPKPKDKVIIDSEEPIIRDSDLSIPVVNKGIANTTQYKKVLFSAAPIEGGLFKHKGIKEYFLPKETFYQISVIDEKRAEYNLVGDKETIELAMHNEHVYLKDGMKIEGSGKTIQYTKAGTLVKQGNNWKIERIAMMKR